MREIFHWDRGVRAGRRSLAARLLSVLLAFAVPSVPVAAGLFASAARADETKSAWQERYRTLLDAVDTTRLELAQAERAYGKGRQRRRLRGEPKTEAVTALEEARVAYAEAKAALEAFPEEARRAGVEPGWLREVEEQGGGPAAAGDLDEPGRDEDTQDVEDIQDVEDAQDVDDFDDF